jgi:sialidase-1
MILGEKTYELIVCPASEVAPGNSEGSILGLKDGRLLLAYTYFYGAEATTMSPAKISGKVSEDRGVNWGKRFPLVEAERGINVTTPSLIRLKSDEIALFYLHKTHRDKCIPYIKKSQDEGKSWGKPKAIAEEHRLYDMANDSVIQLSTGRILLPLSRYRFDKGLYSASCFYSKDRGKSWRMSKNDVDLPKGAMDPHLVELRDGRVLMTIRNRLGRVYKAISHDQGSTWTDVDYKDIQAPDSPVNIRRIPQTGDLLMMWNNDQKRRRPLTSAISNDDGEDWTNLKDIETAEGYSYSHTSITFIDEDALLIYNLYDEETSWVSLKLKKLPITWFYS